MRERVRYFAGLAVLACCFGAFAALAQPAGAVQFNPNPWRGFGFLNMAHQGGEDEAPSNTLFAFKTAVSDRGADMLELDVNLTVRRPARRDPRRHGQQDHGAHRLAGGRATRG